MQKRFTKIIILAIFFILPNFVWAAPSISSAPATISDGESVSISGAEFGTKTVAVPIIDTNFDSDTIGQTPVGWLSPQGVDCLTNSTGYRGSNGLDCSISNWMSNEYFPRVTLDMGQDIGINSYLYFTLWLYMGDPGMQINWKGPLLTSSLTPTYWVGSDPTTNNAFGVGAWWTTSNNPSPRWYNTSVTIQYSQDNIHVFNYCTNGNGASSDSYVFGQWQRIEYTIKTSSSATANDAYVKIERVGKDVPATNATGCVTHGNTSDPWRYFSLPQGVTNIGSTPFNMQMYFDDLYIDNSLARVEICDSSTWSARTHCEIQKPTAWSDTSASASINKGTFTEGSAAYLYVVDENGNVNSNGYQINFAISTDTTAPSAPSGLSVM